VAEAAAAAMAERLTVIYVAYVAHADSDEVLAAWWGTPDSLEDDGTLVWSPERLDMSVATTRSSGASPDGLRTVGANAVTPRFAEGDLPPLKVTARTEVAKRPSAEPEPATPGAEHSDE
jgi:hypothetical protein